MMSLDLDFELPVCDAPPFAPPRLSNDQYLEFIEFNRRVARENGSMERLLANRARPVEAFFVLDQSQ